VSPHEPNPIDILEPHYRMVPPSRLPDRPRNPLHIVLDNLRSAFNVGSIFRTADAGAVAKLHLCGYTAAPPNAKLAKTALGAFDYVPWQHDADAAAAVAGLRARGIPVYAVETAPDAVSCYAMDWPRPAALVFGNEVTGIQPHVLAACDGAVRIPMQGHKNTLNVATAFGIVLFEVLRSWHALPAH